MSGHRRFSALAKMVPAIWDRGVRRILEFPNVAKSNDPESEFTGSETAA